MHRFTYRFELIINFLALYHISFDLSRIKLKFFENFYDNGKLIMIGVDSYIYICVDLLILTGTGSHLVQADTRKQKLPNL